MRSGEFILIIVFLLFMYFIGGMRLIIQLLCAFVWMSLGIIIGKVTDNGLLSVVVSTTGTVILYKVLIILYEAIKEQRKEDRYRKLNEQAKVEHRRLQEERLRKEQVLQEDKHKRERNEFYKGFLSYSYGVKQIRREEGRECLHGERLLLEQPKRVEDSIKQKKLRTLKFNWEKYAAVLKNNGITKLYHFTDISNVASIKTNGGLHSWLYLQNKGININKPGGSDASRDLDRRYSLEDYVRVTFSKNHPMMHIAKKDGRILNPVILEISLDVCYWQGVKFANMNAVRTGHKCGQDIEDLQRIKFSIVKSSNQFNLSEEDKPYYQAEILIPNSIPIEFITNIDKF